MKVGDKVKWESHGGGGFTSKIGEIVRVITKDENVACWRIAYNEFPEHRRMFSSCNLPGGEKTKEAYLVEVIAGQKAKPRIYMPYPNKLVKID